jgi:hypothetical protein
MSEDRRGVVVGLDVHKSSVRLAALRDGELLREVTLGYDHEQLLREVGRGRAPGFARRLVRPGSGCIARWSQPGWIA